VRRGAGICFICLDDATLLLVKRSPKVSEGGTWAVPGGLVEPGEYAFQAALREVAEEVGGAPPGRVLGRFIWRSEDLEFTTFLVAVAPESRAAWPVVLNFENDAASWFPLEDLPRPLHPGVRPMLPAVASEMSKKR
jgi:8-oxo-dGTP pyrophosphatase MutT (NUDIX family)